MVAREAIARARSGDARMVPPSGAADTGSRPGLASRRPARRRDQRREVPARSDHPPPPPTIVRSC